MYRIVFFNNILIINFFLIVGKVFLIFKHYSK